MFSFGLAMLLSALFVRYRDVQPIWDVLLQITFYASPILYVIESDPRSPGCKTLILNSTRWRRCSCRCATR